MNANGNQRAPVKLAALPQASAPPRDPIAKTLADLISPKQLALINRLAKTLKLDPEAACQEMYQANLNEISRKAASALIEHLNAALQEQ